MIWKYKEGRLCGMPALLEALREYGSHSVISVVGAGGKTTFLHQLAEEYVHTGGKVIVTTTTHIINEEKEYFLLEPSEEKIGKCLEQFRQVWAGTPAPQGKLTGLTDAVMCKILRWEIPILIEADGARRMPIKVPAGHEPVIPEETTHVLSVYGLDAVGKPLKEVCFRSELACMLLKKSDTDKVTAEDIALLASSEHGGRKRCPAGARYTVVLNKADNQARMEHALAICKKLESAGISDVAVTSFAG